MMNTERRQCSKCSTPNLYLSRVFKRTHGTTRLYHCGHCDESVSAGTPGNVRLALVLALVIMPAALAFFAWRSGEVPMVTVAGIAFFLLLAGYQRHRLKQFESANPLLS